MVGESRLAIFLSNFVSCQRRRLDDKCSASFNGVAFRTHSSSRKRLSLPAMVGAPQL